MPPVLLVVLLLRVEMTLQDLDLPKIAGFWREVGVASKHNLMLKTPKKLEALFLTLTEDKLTVKTVTDSSGSCEMEIIESSQIDVSGKFIFPGSREIHVLDTDYERYAILKLSLHWKGKDFHVLKYFTRNLDDENEPGFWKFRELTADTGLFLLARHGRCAELLKEVSLYAAAGSQAEPSPQNIQIQAWDGDTSLPGGLGGGGGECKVGCVGEQDYRDGHLAL